MADHVEVREQTYHDSVSLMAVSQEVRNVDGVEAALVAMATDLNLDLLAGMAFDLGAVAGAGANDLLVAVRAPEDVLASALGALDGALAAAARPSADVGFGERPPPRTIAAAARELGADLVLVSVPGQYAFVEAMEALRADLHVMVFSDNVPVEQEVVLKEEARRRNRLVMGPDCGTAIVGGVGLGFANVVKPGPVGIIAASGTGAQQLCCLLDDAGVGVSHALGVGGRDLSAPVRAASTLQALAALDADPATELIVIVSKPPAKEVADLVEDAAAQAETPTVLAFLGSGRPDLTAATGEVLQRLGTGPLQPRTWPAPAPRERRRGSLRGLFAGGTLCDEAMLVAAAELGPIRSNIPLQPDWALPGDLRAGGHLMIDFGDDELTRGRPHPMIDQRLRMDRIAEEAEGPETAVLLLDVVLGHAAHPDPAAELAPALRDARDHGTRSGRDLAVVVSLCGTEGDPQGRDAQAQAFADAGASVHLSNAAAAREAVALIEGAAR